MGLKMFGQLDPITVIYNRVTEADDTRITENGIDIRITNDSTGNIADSSLVANPTFTKFDSIPYLKVAGVWRLGSYYVKNNGTWKQPEVIYKKISGQWKRVY